VTDYSTAKNQFGDFIVLVSFATRLDDVMLNVERIASEQELYCPDVPVFGDGLFDTAFVRDNYERFKFVYDRLSDEWSKEAYINLILGKLTGQIKFLRNAETPVSEAYENIIKPDCGAHYVDIGAYNGDTIREFLSYSGGYSKISAFEPDAKNFKKLLSYACDAGIDTENFHNIAAWSEPDTLTFYSRSGRNSAGSTSHKNVKSIKVLADAVDNYIDCKVDFINIDAEGSDREVIFGLRNTIKTFAPTISCAIYHRNEDFFDIPFLLYNFYGDCEMYVRHFKYFPAWDTNIYVKKKN